MQRSDYLIRKIGFAVVTLIVVIIFNFFLFRILPGDPVKLIVHSPRMTAETQERIRITFGLDKPVWFNQAGFEEAGLKGAFDTQFTAYFRNLFKGDLGVSFSTRRDVVDLLKERVWRTVVLVVLGEFLAIFLGISLGMIAAWRRGTNLDTGILLYGLFTWAMPTFFFGIILLMISGGRLPIGGMVTPGLK
ncbi:MAG TPA: ABC transporter permease, partial [Anaerolineales bacterium]|nr:ABC transporter permease [Anaerolineales bacterium]